MKAVFPGALALKSLAGGFVHLLFYLPLALTAAIYGLPEDAIWPWLLTLPLLYGFGAVLPAVWPRLWRVARLLAAAVASFAHLFLAAGAVSNQLIEGAVYFVCLMIGTAAALKGMQMAMKGWESALSTGDMLAGVILYIAVHPLKLLAFDRLIDNNSLLIGCGIAVLVMYIFIINERLLSKETADSVKSATIAVFKRQNRLLLLLMVSMIVIIASFRQLQRAVEDGFQKLIAWLNEWLARQPEQAPPPPSEQPPSDAGMPMLPPAEPKEPALWMVIMELVLKIIGYSLLFILLVLAVYVVGKKLIGLIGKLAAKLLERGAALRGGEEQYTDEVENLMSLNKFKSGVRGKLRSMMPHKRNLSPQWEDLTSNKERIRFLYAAVLERESKQGYMIREHLTPRETVTELESGKFVRRPAAALAPLADAYEEARYGEREPNDRKVAELKGELLDKKRNE